MATFKEIKANTIYKVYSKSSRLWSGYSSGYYMTLDEMEAVLTPNDRSRKVWEKDDDGKEIRDENNRKVPVLDENGRQEINFVYDQGGWRETAPKKASIWMIRIPDAEIKSVDVYETKSVEMDSDYWDDPDVPEFEDKDVRVGWTLNRDIGERPEIDLNDLHLVQTKHVDDWSRGDSLEKFYASADEKYLRDKANESAEALAKATNIRKVGELSEDTWNFFLGTDGDPIFNDEYDRLRYTKGKAHHDGARHDYRPRISYGTLYAVDELLEKVQKLEERVEHYRDLWTDQREEHTAYRKRMQGVIGK